MHHPEPTPVRILLIEDNPDDAWLLQALLAGARGASFHLECADRLAAGLARLAAGEHDVVLLDLSLPDSQGFEAFVAVQRQAPDVPIVILSGLEDEALALKTVQAGAQDYLVKEQTDGRLLVRAIRYAIERKRARCCGNMSRAWKPCTRLTRRPWRRSRSRRLLRLLSGVSAGWCPAGTPVSLSSILPRLKLRCWLS